MNRMPTVTPEKRRKIAQRTIDRFAENFSSLYREDYHLQLARYAAIPLVLTPELVNHLRSRFLRQVPWIAEADLLLSELCSAVGYEQYVMDADVRACLVAQLEEEAPEAVERVARDLIRYVRYLQKTNRYLTGNEQRRQQWSAMGFIAEQRSDLAAELSLEFYQRIQGLEGETGNEVMGRSDLAWWVDVMKDLAWWVDVMKDLAPRLQDHSNLIEIFERVSRVLQDSRSRDRAWVVQSLQEKSPVEAIETGPARENENLSELQEFEFTIAEYVEESTVNVEESTSKPDWLAGSNCQKISFTVATIDLQNQIKTREGTAWQYVESINTGGVLGLGRHSASIEMIAIPGGEFQMGSEERSEEQPVHQVKVPPFFMGKYPVTQAQWQAVAKLPQVKRSLTKSPSHFKGENRPVEQVSWDDAVEFCARLSKYSGREYGLPSEAAWEYACRSGTMTKYHFGDEITNEVANYQSEKSGTTPVGEYPYSNAFGLYDMHGNIWEWCMDQWCDNYRNAPIDGSAWIDKNSKGSALRVLRGGSWNDNPRDCRSAVRFRFDADDRNSDFGFRLISPARILP
jgi:formylglycine-generating enzyme required for sulfatase activity